MRMDNETGQTAAQWLARASRARARGHAAPARRGKIRETHRARRSSPRGPKHRSSAPASSPTSIAAAVPTREPGKHPATRSFPGASACASTPSSSRSRPRCRRRVELLAPGGRLCVISFHSLEDRLVKRFIRARPRAIPHYAGLPAVPPHARPRLRRSAAPRRPCGRRDRAQSARTQRRAARRREDRRMSRASGGSRSPCCGSRCSARRSPSSTASTQARNRFIELQRLTVERDELDIEWGQLQLEQSTWGTHGRVERVARDDLRC